MAVNFQIPFIPQAQITEQILQALRQGFEERMAGEQLAQRKVEESRRQATAESQIGLEQQRVGLLEKQTKQAEAGLTPIKLLDPQGNEVEVPLSLSGPFLTGGYKLAAIAKTPKKVDPIMETLEEAKKLFDAGDTVGGNAKLKMAQELTVAKAAPKADNMISLVTRSLSGDKEATAVLDKLHKNKIEEAYARGEGYSVPRSKLTPIPVIDKATGELTYKTAFEIAHTPDSFIPAVEGAKQMMKVGVFEDIKGAAGNLEGAVKKLPKGFNPDQSTALSLALRHDPSGEKGLMLSTIHNLATAGARNALTPKQQDVAIAIAQATENAYALRSIAGFGQGSDELRRAIAATLPSGASPSKEYMLKQLAAFQAQVGRLERGLPRVPIRPAEGTAAPTGTGGLKIIRDKDGRIIGIE